MIVHPLAETTEFAGETGDEAITTKFETTYHSGMLQIAQRTTILPSLLSDELGSPRPASGRGVGGEGSNTVDTRSELFDVRGNRIWSRDELGIITRYIIDPATDRLVNQIQDVVTSIIANVPAGW